MNRTRLKSLIRSAEFGLGKLTTLQLAGGVAGLGLLGGAGYVGYRALKKPAQPTRPEVGFYGGVVLPKDSQELITEGKTLLNDTTKLTGLAASGLDELGALGGAAYSKWQDYIRGPLNKGPRSSTI